MDYTLIFFLKCTNTTRKHVNVSMAGRKKIGEINHYDRRCIDPAYTSIKSGLFVILIEFYHALQLLSLLLSISTYISSIGRKINEEFNGILCIIFCKCCDCNCYNCDESIAVGMIFILSNHCRIWNLPIIYFISFNHGSIVLLKLHEDRPFYQSPTMRSTTKLGIKCKNDSVGKPSPPTQDKTTATQSTYRINDKISAIKGDFNVIGFDSTAMASSTTMGKARKMKIIVKYSSDCRNELSFIFENYLFTTYLVLILLLFILLLISIHALAIAMKMRAVLTQITDINYAILVASYDAIFSPIKASIIEILVAPLSATTQSTIESKMERDRELHVVLTKKKELKGYICYNDILWYYLCSISSNHDTKTNNRSNTMSRVTYNITSNTRDTLCTIAKPPRPTPATPLTHDGEVEKIILKLINVMYYHHHQQHNVIMNEFKNIIHKNVNTGALAPASEHKLENIIILKKRAAPGHCNL